MLRFDCHRLFGTARRVSAVVGLITVLFASPRWAAAQVSGDFDGDNFDDLAVGIPLRDVDTTGGTVADAGAVDVFSGSASGLLATPVQLVQGTGGIGTLPGDGDQFGFALAV